MLVATKEFTSALVTINQDMELLKLLELNTISKELDSKSLHGFHALGLGDLTDASLSVRAAEVLGTGACLSGQQCC